MGKIAIVTDSNSGITQKEGKELGMAGEDGTSKYLKRYLFQKFDNKCAKCG